MTMIIGITGGIATGKSTISKMLIDKGYTVIDADLLARLVVEPGEEAYEQIVERFGKGILLSNGQINRKKLGDIVFHDEEKRKILNEIVHPAVRKKMNEEIQASVQRGEKVVFLDIPLLYENRLDHTVEKVIVVYADYETQIERLKKRNQLSEEDAKARIHAQMSIEEKKKRADGIIDNRFSIEDSKKQLVDLLKRWNIAN
ncbi:dephospho-CoA kinase [Fervidibacillus halotolerans]|uniref:Dephospho-CoA kinase n=1 Tax=Fervidibacillus halotolerans TaxID=2980027 RepID=A0A9E8LXP2_9BACI|nr:dephospho-CoA kinase [Fervidibacillus halotolerans]WAA11653.1 dephospho-CoA kinase [Fervidibacillus halotolerans]